jgi:SAM-dependent methyltransferase
VDSPSKPSPEFGLADTAYRAFRPAYPERLYARVLEDLAGPRALAVDIGAGTGLVSGVLARHFGRVVAVEPDAAMAAHLRETAPGVEIQSVSAEQAELEPGSVDLVSCANAFYWMKGPEVAAALSGWLRGGGLFAAWRYPFPSVPAPVDAVIAAQFRERWVNPDHRVMQRGYTRRCVEEQPALELLADERVENLIPMSPAQIVGFCSSTSFGAAYLRSLDEQAGADYLRELEAELREAGGETIEVDFELELILARSRS